MAWRGRRNYTAQGIASGLERASRTLAAIPQMKQNLEQNKKRFDTDMKIKELELRQMEASYDPELLEMEKQNLKLKKQISNAAYQRVVNQLGMTRLKTARQANALESELGNMVNYEKGQLEGRTMSGRNLRLGAGPMSGQGLDIGGGLEIDVAGTLAGKDMPIKSTKDKKHLSDLSPAETEGGWFGFDKTTLDDAKQKMGLVSVGALPEDKALTPEEATLVTMQNIKTEEDIQELINDRAEYEKMGVNVQMILDYHTNENTGKLRTL